MRAREIFEQAWDELADPDHVRWTEPELCRYLTDAIASIRLLKPTLFTEYVALPLAIGRVQRVPTEYSDLIDVLYNTDADGTIGSNILPAPFDLAHSFGPTENVAGQGFAVKSVSMHPENSTVYFVDPPCNQRHPTPYVMALAQREPQLVATADDDVQIPNVSPRTIRSALLEWVLYRAFSKDTESQSSFERAQKHYAAFLAVLGAPPKDAKGVPVAAKETKRGQAA